MINGVGVAEDGNPRIQKSTQLLKIRKNSHQINCRQEERPPRTLACRGGLPLSGTFGGPVAHGPPKGEAGPARERRMADLPSTAP